MNFTFLVMCPKCGHKQKTMPQKVMGSTKVCVYCGRSFVIRSLEKDRIVGRV